MAAFENIVGKGEIARNKQFLLFPQCFQLNQITVSPFIHIFDIISLFDDESKEPKIGISGKGLSALHKHIRMLSSTMNWDTSSEHFWSQIHRQQQSSCQIFNENSKWRKWHNFVKKTLVVTCVYSVQGQISALVHSPMATRKSEGLVENTHQRPRWQSPKIRPDFKFIKLSDRIVTKSSFCLVYYSNQKRFVYF